MMSLIYIVIGLFSLPTWAIEHARPPFECEAFHSETHSCDLAIGYCYERIQTTIIADRMAGWNEFTEINVYIQVPEYVNGIPKYCGSSDAIH